jgi:hypothetical protein
MRMPMNMAKVKIIKAISLPFRMPFFPDFRIHWSYKILYIFVFLFVAFLCVFFFGKKKITSFPFVTAEYVKLRNILKKQGADISINSTPADVRREAIRLGFDKDVSDFIAMYERFRFGGHAMTGVERKRYRNIFSKVHGS